MPAIGVVISSLSDGGSVSPASSHCVLIAIG
jgi:hypothetical protein